VNKKNGDSELGWRLPALEVQQSPGRMLYMFAVDGKQIPQFASVSRVKRGGKQELLGYQRPEVLSHISQIRRYLESDSPMLPNTIVIAFDDRVSFVPSGNGNGDLGQQVRFGTLLVPSAAVDSNGKPGWIVDGQQRVAAIQDAALDAFPVGVVAFIAEDDSQQREQFILVNSTKPLPKGLIYELLPTTSVRLPAALERKRFPAYLLERLNLDEDSPFRGLIRTPTCPEGVVKDNSILRMLENSLSDGILYWHRDPETGEGDVETMLEILGSYWRSVSLVFPDAWGLAPRKSRLMHGVGILSMGLMMDLLSMEHRRHPERLTEDFYGGELAVLSDECRWTQGYWNFGSDDQRKWNRLQNISRDIRLLSEHLSRRYRAGSSAPNR